VKFVEGAAHLQPLTTSSQLPEWRLLLDHLLDHRDIQAHGEALDQIAWSASDELERRLDEKQAVDRARLRGQMREASRRR
jgi:hypothetical protein